MGGGHRFVDEGQSRTHDEKVGHHRIKHDDNGTLVAADAAHDDRGERAADRRDDSRQMAKAKLRLAGPQRDHHANQANDDGDGTANVDTFAEDRNREQRDEKGRGEEDRIGLRQRQDRERIEGGHTSYKRCHRPRRHPAGVNGAQGSGRLVAHDHQDGERKAEQRRKEDRLHRGIVATEKLHDHVVGRIDGKGEEGEQGPSDIMVHRTSGWLALSPFRRDTRQKKSPAEAGLSV